MPNPPKPGSADHWSIVVSFPSGQVRYVRPLHRLAALLGDVWTPSEKLAYDKERRASEPPEEVLDETQAIWQKQQWQRRFLAAEAAEARARRPFQRPNLPIELKEGDE